MHQLGAFCYMFLILALFQALPNSFKALNPLDSKGIFRFLLLLLLSNRLSRERSVCEALAYSHENGEGEWQGVKREKKEAV